MYKGATVLQQSESRPVHEAAHILWKNDDAATVDLLRAKLNTALLTLASSIRAAGSPRILVGPLSVEGEPLSYPFGEARNAISRPSLIDIRRACLYSGVQLKVLILYRDPLAATYSRIHQMRSVLQAHALIQARIVEANLEQISLEVVSIACGNVASIRYEELVAEPTSVVVALAAFTEIDMDILKTSSESIKPSLIGGDIPLPEATLKGLKDFFGYLPRGSADGGGDNELELPEYVIRSKGWWPLVSPDLKLNASNHHEFWRSKYCCSLPSEISWRRRHLRRDRI